MFIHLSFYTLSIFSDINYLKRVITLMKEYISSFNVNLRTASNQAPSYELILKWAKSLNMLMSKRNRSIKNPKSQAKTKYVIVCRILVLNHKGKKKFDMYDLRPSCGHLTCHILQSRDSGGRANPGLCSACHLCLFFLFVPVCFPLSQWSWTVICL